MTQTLPIRPTRRAVTRALGWTAPVLVAGAAAPLSSASEESGTASKCYSISWTAADVEAPRRSGNSRSLVLQNEDGSSLPLTVYIAKYETWFVAKQGLVTVDGTIQTAVGPVIKDKLSPVMNDADEETNTAGLVLLTGYVGYLDYFWFSAPTPITSLSLTIEDLDRGTDHCDGIKFDDPFVVTPDGNLDQGLLAEGVLAPTDSAAWTPYTVTITPTAPTLQVSGTLDNQYCGDQTSFNRGFIKITKITVCV